jgi:site-specific DNA-methyltransferase (adenine-specific)
MRNTVHLCDCMEFMKGIPDKYYELAIVDPPYGIGISSNPVRQAHNKKDWDSAIPKKEYFMELLRISQNQIIWGGNYFLDYLMATQNITVWDKKQPQDFSLAMCEFAWNSIQSPAKIFRYSVLKENGKIHPTQKPVALYKWLLKNYAKPGDKIFDSHVGSGSIRIACYDMGFDFEGCEIDKDYWDAQEDRFNTHIKQGDLFSIDELQDLTYKKKA